MQGGGDGKRVIDTDSSAEYVASSVTLVGEGDRKMLKAVLKQESDKVRHRILEPEELRARTEALDAINDDIIAVLQEEKEEKAVQQAEMELRKGQNMIEHEQEIFSRPARSWFQSVEKKECSKSKIFWIYQK